MKKIWKYLLLLWNLSASAQITFEHSYSLNQDWFLTNLGNNDYKYVTLDYNGSKFNLYNLDHSPFMLNIQIPVQMLDTPNINYQLGYITKTLFDCDSSNIEYAIMLNTPHPATSPNTAIYRTDGTVIFSKDSVGTMFCVGCGSGSYEIHPIMNTPAGAKLYLFGPDSLNSLNVLVYTLCGELPVTITEIGQSNSFVRVYPNPSTGKIIFDITLPSSNEEYELTIFNSNFQIIRTETISGIKTQVDLDNESLSAGNYFYSLQRRNKVFQNGKFIIAK